MIPSVVDYHINNLFPHDQGDQPSYNHVFFSLDAGFALGEILGSFGHLYVYHLAEFSSGSRRLVRPDGTCVFNPEQSIDSFGTGPNSLTAQLGSVNYGTILKVYSLLDIKQLRARKNHEPLGHPGVDLVAVVDGGAYRLSKAAGDAAQNLYNKIQSPDKKKQVKDFFKHHYNYVLHNQPAYNGWAFAGTVPESSLSPMSLQEQIMKQASAQYKADFEQHIIQDDPFSDEPNVKIDFVLPDKISKLVSDSALHSIILGFLSSLSPTSLKKGNYKLFFVVAGPHRGTVGVMKKDLGKWLEIDILDRLNARRELIPVLGEWEHEHLNLADVPPPGFDVDKIKVAKCQTIPISYSVVV